MAFPGPGGGGDDQPPEWMDYTDDDPFGDSLQQAIDVNLASDAPPLELKDDDFIQDMWGLMNPSDSGPDLPQEPLSGSIELPSFADTAVSEGPPVAVPLDYFQQQRNSSAMPPPPPRPPIQPSAQYYSASSSSSSSSSVGVTEPASSSALASSSIGILDPAVYSADTTRPRARIPPLRIERRQPSGSARPRPGTDEEPASKRRKLPSDVDVDAFLKFTEDGFNDTFKRIKKFPSWDRSRKLLALRTDLKTVIKNINGLLKNIAAELSEPETKANPAPAPTPAAPPMAPPADWQQQGGFPPLLIVPPATGRECEYIPTDRNGDLDTSFLVETSSVSPEFETILGHLSPADATTLKSIHADLTEGKFDQMCTTKYKSVYEHELAAIQLKGLQPANTDIYYECSKAESGLYPFGSINPVQPGIFNPATGKHVRCQLVADRDFKYMFRAPHADPSHNHKEIYFLLVTMPNQALPADPTRLYPRELAALLVFRKFCWYGIQFPCVGFTRFPKSSRWGGVPCFLFGGRLYTPGARVSLLAHVATCSSFGYLHDYLESRGGAVVPSRWCFAEYMMLHRAIGREKQSELVNKFNDTETKLTKEQYTALGMLGLIDLSATHKQLMSGVASIVQLVPAICARTIRPKDRVGTLIKGKDREVLYGAYLTTEGRDVLKEYDGQSRNPNGQLYNASAATMLGCEVPLDEGGRYVISSDTKDRVRALGLPLQE